jgi:hypothetical protein
MIEAAQMIARRAMRTHNGCTENGWTAYRAYSLGDVVELVSIGVKIPVAAFYRRTTVKESFETYDSREM